MGDDTHTGKISWHRRISFRLAILLAVTMLAFDFFSPLLYQKVFELFGAVGPHVVVNFSTGEGEVVSFPAGEGEIVSFPAGQGEMEAMTLRASFEYARGMADLLLLGARQEPSGRWHPTAEACKALSSVLGKQHHAFVWLDTQQRIGALSEGLPWEIDRAWPFPLESHTDVAIGGEPKRFSPAIYVPVLRSDVQVGTFVLLTMNDGPGPETCGFPDEFPVPFDLHNGEPELPANAVFMNDEAFEQSMKRELRIGKAVSIAITAAITLLLAFAVSRLVTRRLSRLSVIAGAPADQGAALPGPFDETGRDEIALLARAINSMRGRAAELVDDLAARDARRREWLAQVSHDLRTPLTALLACLDRTELVLEKADPESVKAVMRELLAVARMDADRLQALVDDLFDIARLEGPDPLNLEDVPPGELVQQAVMGLGPMAELKGVKLQATVTRALPILVADGSRLMRAMENLLRNAIQHARQRVEVLACACDEGVRFEVRDDGSGLPQQDGEVTFSKLSGRRSRDDSAGLGLVVAQKVAEAHGGRIGAYNLAEGGAAVWFVIPTREKGSG